MATKMINLRLGEKMINEIDSILNKTTYSNRTEFIREATRRALQEAKKRLALEILKTNYGKATKKTSKKDLASAREEVAKELLVELN